MSVDPLASKRVNTLVRHSAFPHSEKGESSMTDKLSELKPDDHSEVFIMQAIHAMALHSLCPPTYKKFCIVFNELVETRRLPLDKI